MKKVNIRLLTSFFLISLVGLGCFWAGLDTSHAGETNSWRISGKLIKNGDSKGKVLALAGSPDHKEIIQNAVDIGYGSPTKKEIWYYINKNKELIYKLYFSNGKVSKIYWEYI